MSMIKENSKCSTLYTYRKDHKQQEDRVKGPPVRPLCDVSDSYSHKLSYFISNILKEVTDKEPTICDSTEDMMAAIRAVNESGMINTKTTIGSLDVKALYPNLHLDFTIEKAAEEFQESEVEIEGVDYEELGLYLSLHTDETFLRDKGIEDFCPKRRNRVGAPPKITGSGIKVKKEERFKPWIEALCSPDSEKQRVMLTEAMKIVLTTLMKNHIYNFHDELRRQKEGGAIGVDLTGELAKVFMTWWDKQMLRKLSERNINPLLYKRYVDDINIIVDEIDAMSDTEQQGDTRTFQAIQAAGNEIHSSIQLTYDVPSENADQKVPILDLKCWIKEIENGGDKQFKAVHEFYIKDVSSRALIHRDAALSLNNKRTILTQECLRVMKNCHELIGTEETARHLSYFMARMQAVGYDQSFRLQVLKSAFKAYESKKTEEQRGGTPFYRKRSWKRNERRKEKIDKGRNWYKKGGSESVLFIAATPESELKNLLQKEIEKSPFKIKVVEKSGTKLVRLLQKNDPFKRKECKDDQKCMVCSKGDTGGCRESGVTYQISCLSNIETGNGCGSIYVGETGRNGYSRGLQHQDDYRHQRDSSVLWKHCVQKHDSTRQEFQMKIVDRVRNDPTKRQILEATRIRKVPAENAMNSKGEWNSNRVPRISIERD